MMRSKAKYLSELVNLADQFEKTSYDLDALFDEVEIDEVIPSEKTAETSSEPISSEK